MKNSLLFPFSEAPEAPALIEVSPGVRWLRLTLPWALDHVNLWLVDDDAGLALFDTGLGDAPTRALWEQVFAAEARPLTRVLLTHYHPDHAGNAAWLADRCGAEVAMSAGEYLFARALHEETPGLAPADTLAHFRRHGLDEARLAQLAARGNVYRRGVPELPQRVRRIVDGEEVSIGSRRWRAIATQGHSPEHLSFYCASAGVLISGDMILPRITPNLAVPAIWPDEDAVGRYVSSLARFDDLPADTLVLPAHGLPFRGLPRRLAALRVHHEKRDERVLLALREAPHTACSLLPHLFPRVPDAHQLMFALGETIAHLNHLLARGAIRREAQADGTLVFVPSR